MHGCLGAAGVCLRVAPEEVVPAAPLSPVIAPTSPHWKYAVLLFPAALLLPFLSNPFTIRNPGADLEFWNLGGFLLESGTFLMCSRAKATEVY